MAEISVDNTESVKQEPVMNLQDLIHLINIVDLASHRGAFKAEELSAVGRVYDKVMGFLKSAGAFKESNTADTPTEENINSQRSKK